VRVLVTGGAGFIGSALCRHLIGDLGHEARVLDSLTYAASLAALAPVADSPLYGLDQVDIQDAAAVQAVFEAFRPDAVVHLAAETHVDRSIAGARGFVDTNVVGTFTLLEASRAYLAAGDRTLRDRFRFLHVSTDEVFGALGPEGRFCETSAYDPSSPYAATKAASDHLVRAWGRTHGLPVMVSNGSNTYGPHQFPEKLIPVVIVAAMEGRAIPVYGEGAQVRDWLFVDDHARALAAILTSGAPGQTYAIGARAERRNIDVVRQICAIMDRLRPTGAPHERLIAFVADRPGHDARYAIDPAKIERELDWRPREAFDTGLEKTVAWYLGGVPRRAAP
jgi:dTDP-glucose 4,6-dehydratase